MAYLQNKYLTMRQNYQTVRACLAQIALFSALLLCIYTSSAQVTHYVKPVASGTGDGSSWANASGDLQLIINNSTSGDQIWVAAGTYIPNRKYGTTSISANNVDNTFALRNGVSVYGSFAGTETTVEQRKIEDNPTILSGDFSNNDVDATGEQLKNNAHGRTENAHHVVVAYGYAGVFDGFRIHGGNAFGTGVIVNDINRRDGGGIYIRNSGGIFRNVIVKGSRARNYGGAMYVQNSSSAFINFDLMWCYAAEGGGVYFYESSSLVINSIINGCHAGLNTGGGGAIAVESNYPAIINSVVYGNTSQGAGAAFAVKSYSGLHVRNCIVHGNGAGVNKVGNTVSAITYYNSNVQVNGVFGNSGGGNISADPKFVDASRFDFRLKADSPSINTGKDQFAESVTDKAGNPRFNGIIDMGPYEYYAMPVRYVKQIAAGTGDGSSWANASDDLQLMINKSLPGEQVWVAKGTYKPTRTPDTFSAVSTNNRSNTFLLKNGISVFGSFAGNESSAEERNFITNATILSGDLNGDDVMVTADKLSNATLSKNGENVFHVVAGSLLSNVVFDGFTVTGGNANNTQTFAFNSYDGFLASVGGGLYIDGETHTNIFRNITITNCNQTQGAFFCIATNAVVSNISISKCSSTYGVIFNDTCSPFYNNVLISNCYGIAGVAFSGFGGTATVTNATITFNSTAAQGAVIWTFSTEILDIRNSIIFGNTANYMTYNDGGGVVKFTNSLVQGSGGSQAWDTGYGTNNGGNIDEDPLFTNAAEGDFTLQSSSPAINSGNNSFVTGIAKDIAGNARIYESTIDMGAYEYSGESCTKPAAPVAVNQEYCVNATVAELTAQGSNLKWYTSAESETPLDLTMPLTIGTYYVSQSGGTCESERTAVYVNLKVCGYITILSKASCGSTVAAFTSPVIAKKIAGATNYRFRLTRGNEVQTIDSPNASFKFNQLSTYGYGKTYTVDVAVYINGSWQAYGPTCTVTTPVLPVTTLRPENCGITVPFLRSYLYARKVALATNYRFRVTNGVQVQLLESPGAVLKLNSLPQYDFGMTYTIEVAAFVEGAWGDYGDACTVTSPAEPVTTVSAIYCGATLASNNVILANPAELATAYSFRVSDGVNVVTLDYRASRKMILAETGLFGYGKTYTIQVSAMLSTGAVTPYGPQCTVMSVPLPVTRLISSQCGTIINSLNTTLYALRLDGAEAYRFKVTDVTGLVQIIDRNNHAFALSLLPTSQYNMDYTIEIAVLRGTEWGAYGPACSIVAYQGDMNRIAADSEDAAPVMKAITLTAYPNPYTDVFTIEMDTQSEESVTIRAFDMTGKLVEDITVSPSELTSQKLGSRYADGVYNIIVVQGSYQKSFKIVKK